MRAQFFPGHEVLMVFRDDEMTDLAAVRGIADGDGFLDTLSDLGYVPTESASAGRRELPSGTVVYRFGVAPRDTPKITRTAEGDEADALVQAVAEFAELIVATYPPSNVGLPPLSAGARSFLAARGFIGPVVTL